VRLVMVTDSLGLARPEVPPDETWTHLLSRELWRRGDEAIVFARRGLTMPVTAREMLPELRDTRPDVVVLQVGIVDCCRRPWPNAVRRVVERPAPVRDIVRRNRLRLTRLFGRPAVSPVGYRAAFEAIGAAIESQGARLLTVPIAPPGPFLRAQIAHVAEDVETYNAILQDASGGRPGTVVLDPFKGAAVEDLTIALDGHHLTPLGHRLVLGSVLSAIAPQSGGC